MYEAGYKYVKGQTKLNKGQGGIRGGYELAKDTEIRVLRAGNKSIRGGYKAAKGQTVHKGGGG
jgi:hypothetical protein